MTAYSASGGHSEEEEEEEEEDEEEEGVGKVFLLSACTVVDFGGCCRYGSG